MPNCYQLSPLSIVRLVFFLQFANSMAAVGYIHQADMFMHVFCVCVEAWFFICMEMHEYLDNWASDGDRSHHLFLSNPYIYIFGWRPMALRPHQSERGAIRLAD